MQTLSLVDDRHKAEVYEEICTKLRNQYRAAVRIELVKACGLLLLGIASIQETWEFPYLAHGAAQDPLSDQFFDVMTHSLREELMDQRHVVPDAGLPLYMF